MKRIVLAHPIKLPGRTVRALVVERLGLADIIEWSAVTAGQEGRGFALFARFTGQEIAVIEQLSAIDAQALSDAILASVDEVLEQLARPAGPAPTRRLN